MSADVTTVVVAILGVVGTLSSPLLTQWVGNGAKQQQFELEAQRRQEDRHEDSRRTVLQERRTIYAQLNTAARQYEQAKASGNCIPTPK
jgi:type II secretory pathway pseudopilin PulG